MAPRPNPALATSRRWTAGTMVAAAVATGGVVAALDHAGSASTSTTAVSTTTTDTTGTTQDAGTTTSGQDTSGLAAGVGVGSAHGTTSGS